MVLAFGEHRLDLARRELRRGATLIDLEPRAFDLLAFLVQQRDRVVSKDDLLEAVWCGRIVSETALTRGSMPCAGRSATTARQTAGPHLTRKGIRFVGEVTEMPERRSRRCREALTRCCRSRT